MTDTRNLFLHFASVFILSLERINTVILNIALSAKKLQVILSRGQSIYTNVNKDNPLIVYWKNGNTTGIHHFYTSLRLLISIHHRFGRVYPDHPESTSLTNHLSWIKAWPEYTLFSNTSYNSHLISCYQIAALAALQESVNKLTQKYNSGDYTHCIYDFNYSFSEGQLRAPWYSALTDSLVARTIYSASFFEDLRDSAMLDLADRLIKSCFSKEECKILSGCLISQGDKYHFEEYPMHRDYYESPRVFNGNIIAICNLKWCSEQKLLCNEYNYILQRSIETVSEEISLYGMKSGWTYYNAHKRISNRKYHKVNIACAESIFAIMPDQNIYNFIKRGNSLRLRLLTSTFIGQRMYLKTNSTLSLVGSLIEVSTITLIFYFAYKCITQF
jgi:hypothetical protein